MPLVDQTFADTFIFSRAASAAYVNAGGEATTAAADEPRFDHDDTGTPRGLLIEGRPEAGAPDRLKVEDGDWAVAPGTVLHIFQTPQGETRQRAWYVETDPRAAVDACLGARGHHRLIVFVPGHLRNRGGYVRWRRRDFALGGILLSEPGVAIGAADNIPLLEG